MGSPVTMATYNYKYNYRNRSSFQTRDHTHLFTPTKKEKHMQYYIISLSLKIETSHTKYSNNIVTWGSLLTDNYTDSPKPLSPAHCN